LSVFSKGVEQATLARGKISGFSFDYSCPAAPPDFRGCARGIRLSCLGPGRSPIRQICRADDRRRLAPSASAGREGSSRSSWAGPDSKFDACTPSKRTGATRLPVGEKQAPRLLENLVVHLRRLVERMRSRDGGEIFVAQFQLQGAREISAFAQAPSYHFAEAHERGLQALGVARVFVEGVLVADRFRVDIFSDFVVEPSTRIFAARLPGQRQAPFSEAVFQIASSRRARSPTF
jgi:hypothetical protein